MAIGLNTGKQNAHKIGLGLGIEGRPLATENQVQSLKIEGIGLHTGQGFCLETVSRCQSEQQINFISRYEGMAFEAPARYSRLSGTSRATALVLRGEGRSRVELRTVEHYLAASFISKLWDLDIFVSFKSKPKVQPEVFELPVLDGASLEWWSHLAPLRKARDEKAMQPFKAWLVNREFKFCDDKKCVILKPFSNGSTGKISTFYECQVDFGEGLKQEIQFEMDWLSSQKSWEFFEKNIAPARTFGFLHELKMLEERGLAKGGSLQNALVLDQSKVVNEGGFRVPNELAAHKMLDLIGDFSLLEYPVLGRVQAHCAGHALHLRALSAAVEDGALVQVSVDPKSGVLKWI